MPGGLGKYLKVKGGVLKGARVMIEVATLDSGGVTVTCAPTVFSEIGYDLNPEAPGFLAWRRGAEAGARWGAQVARVASAAIEIQSIVGPTWTPPSDRWLVPPHSHCGTLSDSR
jgi:hypothetical protein